MTYMYVEHVPVQNKWKTKWQNIEIHFKIFDINHLTFTAFLTSLLQTVYGSSSLNHGHQEQRTFYLMQTFHQHQMFIQIKSLP